VLVYSRYARGDMDSSSLQVMTSRDGRTVSLPDVLAFGGDVEDAPAFVTTQGETWLYFASGDADLGNAQLWRSRLVGKGSFSPPEKLAGVPGLRRLIQWPRWVDAG